MESLDKLIEQGELAREQEDYTAATEAFDQVFILASEQEDYVSLINVIAQRILVHKHEYMKTNDQVFNELMFGDVKVGLSIVEDKKMTGQPRAVMYLRAGDYYLAKKEFDEAVKNYTEALLNADPSKPGEYAEYASFLGFAKTLAGDESAIALLMKALELAETDVVLRSFHKLVIVSGILARLAEAYAKYGKTPEAKKYLDAADQVAQALALDHKMPVRLKQIQKLRKELAL